MAPGRCTPEKIPQLCPWCGVKCFWPPESPFPVSRRKRPGQVEFDGRKLPPENPKALPQFPVGSTCAPTCFTAPVDEKAPIVRGAKTQINGPCGLVQSVGERRRRG